MHVLGIDLSSKAIDLVLLDENDDIATHTRIDLTGPDAFERTRDVQDQMPDGNWYERHGVYLIALERPFIRFGQDAIRLIQGAALACIPRHIRVWEVTPSQWKQQLGVSIKVKPDASAFRGMVYATPSSATNLPVWPQDAFDALGVALYARDLNAKAISDALGRNVA